MQLNCTPQAPEALWPLEDPSWSADQVIDRINAVRRSMHVPFYIYDLHHHGIPPVEEQLQRLVGCGAETLAYKYNGGEFHFLKALVSHPWRTRDASDATLLIVPIFTGWDNHRFCVGEHRI